MLPNNLLKLANNTKYYGLRNIFTHKAKIKNNKCGDNITLEIVAKNNRLTSMRYEGESCVYCQISANLLAEKIDIINKDNFMEIYDILKSSLFEDKTLGKDLKNFSVLFNVKNLNRSDCIMLPLNALRKILEK